MTKLPRSEQQEAIAIVGLSCRFPQANDSAAFWELLVSGGDAITEVPASRFDINEYYDEDSEKPGKICTRYGGFLDQVDQFDPAFFGIPPRAAKSMDPQQRLILEVAWEALEHANIPPASLKETQSGVFIGVSEVDYAEQAFADLSEVDIYSGTGNGQAFVSGRLAYVLGLKGPAKSINTACSSSLVAIHDACQSLRYGESELAIAGGTNLILNPNNYIFLTRSKSLSPDGRCKTFDAKANGFARGEGCGVVVLKRLCDALEANDNVLAVIRGSAVNHDGASGGLTMPNPAAQETLIRTALKNSGLKPHQVGYLEANGTGTMLGDPLELQAAGNVFGADPQRSDDQPLYVGSVKSNIGHSEPAAGIAGLIKVVLSMQANCLPKQVHYEHANPKIPWERLPFEVVSENKDWPIEAQIAGISSFGLSGTNAHVIVEGLAESKRLVDQNTATETDENSQKRPFSLLNISAKSPAALAAQAQQYTHFLAQDTEADFADICYSAAVGRQHFPYRLSIVAHDSHDAQQQLSTLGSDNKDAVFQQKALRKSPSVAFLFAGQGAQLPKAAYELYQSDGVFRDSMRQCDQLFEPLLGLSLLNVLYADDTQDEDVYLKHRTQCTESILFAIEYSLAKLWISWGVVPKALIGQGVGELVAACIADVFSLEDAIKLVVSRMDEHAATAENITYHSPKVDIISNLSGALVSEEICSSAYWVQHTQNTVRFEEGVDTLRQLKIPVFLEISSQGSLLNSIAQSESEPSKRRLLISLSNGQSNWQTLLNSLGAMHQLGVKIDWNGFEPPQTRQKVSLPYYPFQRQRYWVEATGRRASSKEHQEVVKPAAVVDESFSDCLAAASLENRKPLMQDKIRERVAAIMAVPDPQQIDIERSLLKQGMDSLMTTELITDLSKILSVTLGSTLVFNHPSVEQLSEYLLSDEFSIEQKSALNLTAILRTKEMALSFAQQRSWMHQAAEPKGCAHNLLWLLRISGDLKTEVLQQSLDVLVKRHEILRTTFPRSGGQAVAVVGETNSLPIRHVDLGGTTAVKQKTEIQAFLQLEEQERYFDLATGPLSRVTLIKLNEQEHLLLLCQHHIITNMPSMIILTQEWYASYNAFLRGQKSPLSKPTLQYLDYAVWQRRALTEKALKARQGYWQQWFGASKPTLLELPTDHPRQHPSYQAETIDYQWSVELTRTVKQLNQQCGSSQYAFVMTALAILLSRYSTSDDIVIGSPFSTNWNNGDGDAMVGFLGGLLQLRIDLSEQPTFKTLLAQVSDSVQSAMVYQDIPLPQLERLLQSTSSGPAGPFFRVMLNFFSNGAPEDAIDALNQSFPESGIQLGLEHPEQIQNRPDLALWVYEDKQHAEPVIRGVWRYRLDLFDKETAMAIAADFQQLLKTLCAQPDQAVNTLPFQPSLNTPTLQEVKHS